MGADVPQSRNGLLSALPEDELGYLRPGLQRVKVVLQQVLHEIDNPMEDVYFLEGGLASLTADTGDGGQVEVGITGREGFVGTALLLNPRPVTTHRAVVQMPGTALRMHGAAFREAVAALPVLRDRCLRYIEAVMVQTAQSSACNARHELPERLARWLLIASARAETDELPMTQEFLSYMLGVRRAGVSVVANSLQAAGLIRQSRGKLTLLDRAGLEAKACSCFHIIETNRRRIMEETTLPTELAADQ